MNWRLLIILFAGFIGSAADAQTPRRTAPTVQAPTPAPLCSIQGRSSLGYFLRETRLFGTYNNRFDAYKKAQERDISLLEQDIIKKNCQIGDDLSVTYVHDEEEVPQGNALAHSSDMAAVFCNPGSVTRSNAGGFSCRYSGLRRIVR